MIISGLAMKTKNSKTQRSVKPNIIRGVYRPWEYFSVAMGEEYLGKRLIKINQGGIFRFCGRLINLCYGYSGPVDLAGNEYYQNKNVIVTDIDDSNGITTVDAEDYNTLLAVEGGDKLYFSVTFVSSTENSPLQIQGVSISRDIVLGRYNNYSLTPITEYVNPSFGYSVEKDYMETIETSETSVTYNFLIATFEESGDRLIKEQIHSGILFIPRISRLGGDQIESYPS